MDSYFDLSVPYDSNSDDGWGACAHQFAMDHPIDAKAGEANLFSKDPKRIIHWISKA